jgi:type II secretory pathway pseudopilin PulG
MTNSRFRLPAGAYRRMAIVCLGFGLLILWYSVANRIPVVTIPRPVMPQPNAFDVYVSAGNAVTGEKQIQDAVGSKPTASYSLEQKQALVRQNVGVVNTLHKGFAYPYLNPPVRSFRTLLPYYKSFRGLARLLSLRGHVRAEKGDWMGATDSYLDAMRIGADIPHGSPLLGALVGINCQSVGRKPIWGVVEHLNAAQSHVVLTRLTNIMEKHLPFADSIQEEKWLGQAALLEIFQGSTKPDSPKSADDPESEALPADSAYHLVWSKKRIMDNYTGYLDASSKLARQPYALHLHAPSVPKDMFNQVIAPVFLNSRLKDVENETQNRLLLVTLALHVYRLVHGHYPKSLAELAPATLRKLPDDPFALQGTFKYGLDGKSYVLYSVGPDGKDDGGTPIDSPKEAVSSIPDSRYAVRHNSVGDVVAGINMQ